MIRRFKILLQKLLRMIKTSYKELTNRDVPFFMKKPLMVSKALSEVLRH